MVFMMLNTNSIVFTSSSYLSNAKYGKGVSQSTPPSVSRIASILLRSITIGLLLLAQPSLTNAQMGGGVSSGQATPREVKPAEMAPSALRGDVDLFTGRYSAQYPLGSVSTPGGLSYALQLQYSPTTTGGTTPTLTKGIPYGEGWAPNIPMINVAYTQHFNLTESEHQEQTGNNGNCTWTANCHTPTGAGGWDDGEGYWSAPTLNIPGVVSGTAIFKNIDNGDAVFVLNTFEEFVELRLSGSVWTVYLPDGHSYHFDVAQTSFVMPSDQRGLDYEQAKNYIKEPFSGSAAASRLKVMNSIMPRERVLTWYCSKIADPVHLPGESILFLYRAFGKFDFYQELQQAEVSRAIGLERMAYNGTTIDFSTPIPQFAKTEAYQEVFLERLVAGTTQTNTGELELVYGVQNGMYGPDMVTPSANSTDWDDLYLREVIYQADAEHGFADWDRYRHIKSTGGAYQQSMAAQANFPNPSNPYKSDNGYWHEPATAPTDNGIQFEHSILESANIPVGDLVPGDLYELNTVVRRSSTSSLNQAGWLDINITGHSGQGPDQYGSGWMDDQEYRDSHKLSVFNTFNRALKWNTLGDAAGQTEVHTHNLFTMPLLPSTSYTNQAGQHAAYGGITIQIGPANSDGVFDRKPWLTENEDMLTGPDQPSAYMSYAHARWALLHDQSNNDNVVGVPLIGPLSHDRMPDNFGIGLPWSMMLNVHRYLMGQFPNGVFDVTAPGVFEPKTAPMFSFWWNDHSQFGVNWENRPTCLGPEVTLKSVELVRYSKRPYLLTAVRSYVFSGEYDAGYVDSGKRLAAELIIDHELNSSLVPLPDALPQTEEQPVDIGRHQNQYTISAIHQVPVDPSSANPVQPDLQQLASYPTTYFSYAPPTEFLSPDFQLPHAPCGSGAAIPLDPMRLALNGGQWLRAITDPLGAVTTVDYNDPRDHNLTYYQTLAGAGLLLRDEHDENDPCDDTYKPVASFTASVTPTVKALKRSNSLGEQAAITSYSYGPQIRKPRPLLQPTTGFYSHYRGDLSTEADIGFRYTEVLGPENGQNIRNKSTYEFYGDLFFDTVQVHFHPTPYIEVFYLAPQVPEPTAPRFKDYLCFGKLHRTRQFDPNGRLLAEDVQNYDWTLAYLNGETRPYHNPADLSAGSFDYFDYQPGFELDQSQDTEDPSIFLQGGAYDPPTFYPQKADILPGLFPDAALLSYFLKKVSDVHTEFDPDGCAMAVPDHVTSEDAVSPSPRSNAGGTGYVNPITTSVSQEWLTDLSANGLTTLNRDRLVSASPLAESDIAKAIQYVRPTQTGSLTEVLRAQQALSTANCQRILAMAAPFPVSTIQEVLKQQPYLADPVLELIISNDRITISQKQDLLIKQAHLSSTVVEILLCTELPLGSEATRMILRAQPPLHFDLLTLLIGHPLLPNAIKRDVLLAQPALSSVLLRTVTETSLPLAQDVITLGRTQPKDEVLNDILANPAGWTIDGLRNILMSRVLPLTNAQKAAINNIPGLTDALPIRFIEDRPTVITDCGDPCLAIGPTMITTTEYSYYEAEHDGMTTAEGYKQLFGFEDRPTPFQLKWEPSWLLFSKKSWSPMLPGAYTTEENFYYHDLRNRYDRMADYMIAEPSVHFDLGAEHVDHNVHWYEVWEAEDAQSSEENGPYHLPSLDYFQRTLGTGLRTADVYQHRTQSKANRSTTPVISNEFFEYRARWNEQPLPSTTLEPLPPGPPCPEGWIYPVGGGSGYEDWPPVAGTFFVPGVTSDNYQLYCLQVPPGSMLVLQVSGTNFYVVPSLDEALMVANGFEVMCSNGQPPPPPPPPSEEAQPLRMPPIASILKKAFQLYRIDRQADEKELTEYHENSWFEEELPLMAFENVGPPPDNAPYEFDRWDAVLPYPTIMQSKVHERNAFQQEQVVENERGLKTKFNYDQKRYIAHFDAVHPCNNHFSTVLDHPGTPSSITIGVEYDEVTHLWQPRSNALTTTYAYKPNIALASIVDPNGMETTYEYDVYGRLKEGSRNGELLSRTNYHWFTFDPATPYDYFGRTQANYTESFARIDKGTDLRGIQTRTYVDPAGMAFNTLSRAVGDINSPGLATALVSSGKMVHDTWNRPIRSFKPYVYSLQGNAFTFELTPAVFNGTPDAHSDSRYEMDQRGRPLFTSAPGIAIEASDHLHNSKLRYQLLDDLAFTCMLGLSPGEAYLLGATGFDQTVWRMTETKDPDDQLTRGFSNAFGQRVATQSLIGNGQYATTLFVYDDQGNLSLCINPEKQWTTYKYNLLGQLYQKQTVDGGITKYMYDRSGNVVLEQDAVLRAGEFDAETQLDLPEFRRYDHDLFNRPTTQSRVRLKQPRPSQTAGDLVSYTVDPLAYQTVHVGLDENGELAVGAENNGLYNAWGSDFSTASTQIDLAHLTVVMATDHHPGINTLLISTPIQDLLGDLLIEKRFVYDHPLVQQPASHTPSNTMYADVQTLLNDSRPRMKGRLSHSIAYPHRLFRDFLADQNDPSMGYSWIMAEEPVQYDFLSYNSEGQVEWEVQQFNPNRITADAPGLIVRIEYPEYDLLGNLRTENIDVHMDKVLDIQYHHTYDAWGRLHRTYASHADVKANGELLAENTYDDALGILTGTKYFRTCDNISSEVDHIEYTHDLRDRLLAINSRFFDHQLYYDGATPPAPGEALLADHHFNGQINGALSTYTLAQAFQAPTEGFTQPTAYGYQYDGLGRLLNADAVQGDAVLTAEPGSPLFTVGDEHYTFDRIGNLTTLSRQWLLNETTAESHGWSYEYHPSTNRLLKAKQLAGTALPDRLYTYDQAGDLLTDSHNEMQQTYGRANLPMTYQAGSSNGLVTGYYLYNSVDARIFKLSNLTAKDAVDENEFYLRDALGREVGVLNLNGIQPDQEGDPVKGDWKWYVFAGQRFARIAPIYQQLPNNYNADLATREMADQTNTEYLHLVSLISAAYAAPGGIQYPMSFVHLQPADGPEQWITEGQFTQLAATDLDLKNVPAEWYNFTSSEHQVELQRSDKEGDVVLVSARDLVNAGQQRGSEPPAQAPFVYTTFANTHLSEVVYYVYDHLGNTRVTYSDACKNWDNDANNTNDQVLEQVADYYPYGKVLREYVNGRQEKYLTTQHERDQETGLDYRGARYYDSDVARFLSLDPAQAEYPAWNPYQYVLGNPISFTDPTGKRVDGYVDEEGNYLGDDGSTTSHETRVIGKDKWNELTQNGSNTTGKEKSLQSSGMLLREWDKGIRLTDQTWSQLESHGGTRFEPALTNLSDSRVMWKPDNSNNPRTNYFDALVAPPNKDIYHPIDGIKTWRMQGMETYHVPDGERLIVHPTGLVEAASYNYQLWSLAGYGYGVRSTDDWRRLSHSKP